jgi:hypothetical protein
MLDRLLHEPQGLSSPVWVRDITHRIGVRRDYAIT